jgi:hypothetical protein
MQTVSRLSVVRVLAISRSEYEVIAEKFQDSSRAVLENLLRLTRQVRQPAAGTGWYCRVLPGLAGCQPEACGNCCWQRAICGLMPACLPACLPAWFTNCR